MPKLPSINPKKLIKILNLFGFKIDRSTGSHFIFYNPKTKKRAVIPYHLKDLPKGTIMSILKEAGISRKELKDLLK